MSVYLQDSVPTPEKVKSSFAPTWGLSAAWQPFVPFVHGWINEHGEVVPFNGTDTNLQDQR